MTYLKASLLFILSMSVFSISYADKTILVLGDSLSAAYQMDEKEGWVSLLGEKLKTDHAAWTVQNASSAGETTAGGLNRLPTLLAQNPLPDILIIELGANDGLQIKPFGYIQQNLIKIIQMAKEKKIKVYLAEMHVPPNFGLSFSQGFNAIFHEVSQSEQVHLIPFFLDQISTNPKLVQADGLHPSVAAQSMILDSIYRAIQADLD